MCTTDLFEVFTMKLMQINLKSYRLDIGNEIIEQT